MKDSIMIEHLENKTKITIQNELTINNAAVIYNLLAEGLQCDGDLIISIPNPFPVDVTFMQILHAFVEKCKSTNKKVLFEIEKHNELITALIKIGYCDAYGVLKTSIITQG
jgi:hypothetical protein